MTDQPHSPDIPKDLDPVIATMVDRLEYLEGFTEMVQESVDLLNILLDILKAPDNLRGYPPRRLISLLRAALTSSSSGLGELNCTLSVLETMENDRS